MPTRKRAPKSASGTRSKKKSRKKLEKKSRKKLEKKSRKKLEKKSRKKPEKKSQKKSKRKTGAKPKRRTPVAVGDAVTLPPGPRNEIGRYDPRLARSARAAEALEGIVCSIRDITTGKLVRKTRGDLSRFVLEIFHSQTFRFQFSSEKNTGGPGADDVPASSPLWLKLRALLQEMAAEGHLFTSGSGMLSQDPFASLLDGWRVVKLRAELVERLE